MSNQQSKTSRFMDWSDIQVQPPSHPPRSAPMNDNVVYAEDQVTAYFDSNGRSVAPHFAAYAKVWTPDGALRIITLDSVATS